MIKIETHTHVKGGSSCAIATASELADDLFNNGFNGAVLTNHYCYNYFRNYPGDTKKEKLDFYFSLIDGARKEFEKRSLRLFYGAEVRVKLPDDLFAEYMVFGFDEQFLYDNKPLFELTQEELFSLCDKSGVFMYQTHPFRHGVTLGNPKHMHGAEAFNGHFHHVNDNALAKEFCKNNNLVGLSGTDYHGKNQPLLGGIYIPDGIQTNAQLKDCFFNREFSIIENESEYQKYLIKRQKEKEKCN
jgi:hypothetical protein